MATLIAAYTRRVALVDARCHDATSPASECDCFCGGANHGVGQARAIENTRELAERWIREYADRKGLADVKGELGELVQQPSLW